jgi:hypothetical protein
MLPSSSTAGADRIAIAAILKRCSVSPVDAFTTAISPFDDPQYICPFACEGIEKLPKVPES